MTEFMQQNKGIIKTIVIFIAIFLVVATLGKLKEYRFIGSGLNATNTITVAGEGKIERAPDTAKVSFTITTEAKDLKTAQDAVSAKVDTVTKALAALGVEEKYIKTDGYDSYPKYQYQESTIRCITYPCPSNGQNIIVGYEVSHAITVAIKDLDKVNDVLGALGTAGVSNISGPNFGFEDDKAVAREARDLAIADAKAQAKALAKSLGVKLVGIVSFSEGGSYPMALYAERDTANGAKEATPAPALPVGDQTLQSSVTIVYEIR